ncbi:MAG: prolipoprotein diacylglyceryl transferase family protein, partial [Polyangiaceae bacterium]
MPLGLPSYVWSVSPIFATPVGIEIRYYSLCVELALLGGAILFGKQIKRGGGDIEEVGDFLAYACPSVLLGARLAHAAGYDIDKMIEDPLWVLRIGTGGMASHGALLGLGLAMYWFTRRRAIALLDGLDRLTFSAALASIVFRVGHLFNSEIV